MVMIYEAIKQVRAKPDFLENVQILRKERKGFAEPGTNGKLLNENIEEQELWRSRGDLHHFIQNSHLPAPYLFA